MCAQIGENTRRSQLMNKNKLAGLVLAGLLGACSVMPAFAADITIDGSGEKFEAYQLLTLTTSLKAGDHNHAEGAHSSDCYNYSYKMPEKYEAVLKQVTGQTDEAGVIEYIQGLDADGARTFADSMFAQVKGMAADKTASGKTFSDVGQGYYLIVETKSAADPDSVSLVMLDTAGQDNLTVATKEGVPTLEKKIVGEEKDVDAADYAIGDTVQFKLTGTMPDNIDNYDTYKYIFHDALSDGLKLDTSSIMVAVDGVAANDFEVKTTGLDEGCSFEVAFDNIKAGRTITKNTKVEVTYNAELTENAKLSNSNEAHLEFSNNPYSDGNGDTSKTPGDKVTAFSYKVIVNKVDGKGAALAGANFELQKKNAEGGWDLVKENILADGQTTFNFSGLDAGEYKLVETKVPDGYNKADDVEFQIVAVLDEDSADPKILSLKVMQGDKEVSSGDDALFTVVVDAGTAITSVVNNTGIRLPSTGGAGTYLIYGGGGAAVAGAAILFALKKKSKA